MQVVITGCNGQLGHELLRLAPQNALITAVDIDELDLTDQSAVNSFMAKSNPQLIINAAAYTAVDQAEAAPTTAYAVNRDAVKFLATAAVKNGATIIHISTDYVFSGTASVPYQPDAPTEPAGIYGKSKLAGEHILRQIMPTQSVIIRTAWLYSPYGANFLKTMLRLMNERPELRVIADQIGTPTSAATLAETIWRFAEHPQLHGIFHWTDAGKASWYEFAESIRAKAINQGLLPQSAAQLTPITSAEYPLPAPRPAYSLLDKSLTYQTLGIKGIPWENALDDVLNRMNKP